VRQVPYEPTVSVSVNGRPPLVSALRHGRSSGGDARPPPAPPARFSTLSRRDLSPLVYAAMTRLHGVLLRCALPSRDRKSISPNPPKKKKKKRSRGAWRFALIRRGVSILVRPDRASRCRRRPPAARLPGQRLTPARRAPSCTAAGQLDRAFPPRLVAGWRRCPGSRGGVDHLDLDPSPIGLAGSGLSSPSPITVSAPGAATSPASSVRLPEPT